MKYFQIDKVNSVAFLVMNRLGPDLGVLLQKQGTFSPKTALMIGIRLL